MRWLGQLDSRTGFFCLLMPWLECCGQVMPPLLVLGQLVSWVTITFLLLPWGLLGQLSLVSSSIKYCGD